MFVEEKNEAEVPVFYDEKFRARKKHDKYKEVPAPEPALEGPIADTHAHLTLLAHRDVVLARAAFYHVDFICNITDLFEGADRAYSELDGWRDEAAKQIDSMFPQSGLVAPRLRLACGCHPHNAKEYNDAMEEALLDKLHDPRTCILGEVGLDYHYDLSPRDMQREVFRRQIRLAHNTGLPLALHVREAHDEAMQIMKDEGFPAAGTILHCFNLGPDELAPWLEEDCYIAFGGPVTFKKADEVREAAKLVPENRLLTETDCPYMTPEPLRGTENGPEYTIFTAAMLAQVRGCEPGQQRERFLQTVYKNALDLLDREPTAWQKSAR